MSSSYDPVRNARNAIAWHGTPQRAIDACRKLNAKAGICTSHWTDEERAEQALLEREIIRVLHSTLSPSHPLTLSPARQAS